MSDIHPISPQRHGTLRWRRFQTYSFAAKSALVPLAAAEVSKAAIALPLAFVTRGADWTLAAVLGLAPEQNLYVDQRGQWTASYIPAAFRGYPFSLQRDGDGRTLFCVDEASNLVGSTDGEPFFADAAEPSAAIKEVQNFLVETSRNEAALKRGCKVLHEAGVIEPWPITIKAEGRESQVAGMYRISEVALKALDDVAFGRLRQAGVVGVAYAQLISMGNLADLGKLAQARAQAEAAERTKAEVKPMITLPEDSSIDWDWSKVGKL